MKDETPAEKTVWWKSGFFVALLGAAIPAATFAQGWLQKEKELELQRHRQFSDLRIAYANLMIEGGVEKVELLADFVAQTESDPEIRGWAKRQSEVASAQRKRIQDELAEEQKKAAAALQKVADATAELENARRTLETAASGAARNEASAKEAAARSVILDAEAKAAVAQNNVASSREALKGRAMVQQMPVQQPIATRAATHLGIK